MKQNTPQFEFQNRESSSPCRTNTYVLSCKNLTKQSDGYRYQSLYLSSIILFSSASSLQKSLASVSKYAVSNFENRGLELG